jgi:SAM-dependent methyltransferase
MSIQWTFEEAMAALVRDAPSLSTHRASLSRLIGSPEFAATRAAWRRELSAPADDASAREAPPHLETASRVDDETFVRLAYQCLLAREADPSGLAHYVESLRSGDTRAGVLRAIALSDEFERRYRSVPVDTQLCELANPAKWDNPEWLEILHELVLADDKLLMHRKPYEFAQLVYGCRRLGALRADARVLSVGAGHELVLFWLANHVRRVVATDRYEGQWQSSLAREGDPGVLARPSDYAPFPYRQAHLSFVRMDGCVAGFLDATFDIVYSLSSIEHFGGIEQAIESVNEMARVLKPGGILALATEYVIAGPPREETFQPAEIVRLVQHPHLHLVEPIDDAVYRRYRFDAVDLERTPLQAPHMVVRLGDTVFTSVMMFLRKS